MANTAAINPAFTPDKEGEDLAQRMATEGQNNEVALNMDERNSKFSSEEETILEVLRDIVRKCTNSDPTKRPTASEVLDLLNKCPAAVK